ncbi:MAG: protein rep, partial [Actinomycetes bacterium]
MQAETASRHPNTPTALAAASPHALDSSQASPRRRSRYVAENAATEAGSAARSGPLDLAEQRSARLRLLDRLQSVTTLDRLTHCRVHRAYGWEFVGIVKREGLASYAGLQTCESPWVCPMCSAKIRHRRALALSRAVVDWVGTGGGLLFPTLTLAHLKRDGLDVTLGHLLAAWRSVMKSGTWRRLCKRLGLAHSVRAVEVTYGLNGWHPHLHVLLFTVAALDDDQAEEVRSVLF